MSVEPISKCEYLTGHNEDVKSLQSHNTKLNAISSGLFHSTLPLQVARCPLGLRSPSFGSVSNWALTPPSCCSTRFFSSTPRTSTSTPWRSTKASRLPTSVCTQNPAVERAKSSTSNTSEAALLLPAVERRVCGTCLDHHDT